MFATFSTIALNFTLEWFLRKFLYLHTNENEVKKCLAIENVKTDVSGINRTEILRKKEKRKSKNHFRNRAANGEQKSEMEICGFVCKIILGEILF